MKVDITRLDFLHRRVKGFGLLTRRLLVVAAITAFIRASNAREEISVRWITWVSLLLALIAILLAYVARDAVKLKHCFIPEIGILSANLLRAPPARRPGIYASRRYILITIFLAAQLSLQFWCIILSLLSHGLFPLRPSRYARTISQKRRRASSPSVEQVRSCDRRRPILLLRSFDDDDFPGEEIGFDGETTVTFEEMITRDLWRWGPVFAIGQPGEGMPRAGAARTYVSDDAWQAQVQSLIQESQMIVMVAGETPGLQWEIQQVIQMGASGKLVLVVPPLDLESMRWRYERFLSNLVESNRTPELLRDMQDGTLAVVFPTGSEPVVLNGTSYDSQYILALQLAARITRDRADTKPTPPADESTNVQDAAAKKAAEDNVSNEKFQQWKSTLSAEPKAWEEMLEANLEAVYLPLYKRVRPCIVPAAKSALKCDNVPFFSP